MFTWVEGMGNSSKPEPVHYYLLFYLKYDKERIITFVTF